MERNRRDSDDRRGSYRGRDEGRDAPRDRDQRSRDRGEYAERGQYGGRDRDEGRRSSRDRDDDRPSRGSSGYTYQARGAESLRGRAQDSKFDKLLKPGIKSWTPKDGENRVRIVPPTWELKPGEKYEHFGIDIWVHYGVGPDRQSYLDLQRMLGEPDPISEECDRFRKTMDPDNKEDQQYLRDLESRQRVLVYIVDRENEKDGVQAWAMPRSIDMDLVKIAGAEGEVLNVDDPEDGYDILFSKEGKGVNTKYKGLSVARRSSPLQQRGDDYMQFALKNPLPEQLQYFDYDHIAKAFGGQGQHKGREDREEDRGRGRDRDDSDDDRPSRGRDDDRRSRDREGGHPDDRTDRKGDGKLTWDDVHSMTPAELDDLIEQEKLDVDPREAKDDEDLADWICDEMKIVKEEPARSERPRARGTEPADGGAADKLRRMREERGR